MGWGKVLCSLPGRKLTPPGTPMIKTARDLPDDPSRGPWETFGILTRDSETTCRELLEGLLLSSDSATQFANIRPDRLCQLLLLDVFRAACMSWASFWRELLAGVGFESVEGRPDTHSFFAETEKVLESIHYMLTEFRELQESANSLLGWLAMESGHGIAIGEIDADRESRNLAHT